MILINGCSFTEGYDLENINDNWPSQLSHIINKPISNIALGGSSNDRIARTTHEWLVTNPDPEHVIIGWTTYNRNELYHHEGLYIRGLSTGSESEIEYNPADIKIVHKNWIQYNLNRWINYRNWIYHLLFLQKYFESKNIKYTFFNAIDNPLIIDFLNGTDTALELADLAWQWRDKSKYKAERTIHNQYKELVDLCQRVNLDNWILPDSTMQAYVNKFNCPIDKNGHYYADGYKIWAEFVVDSCF